MVNPVPGWKTERKRGKKDTECLTVSHERFLFSFFLWWEWFIWHGFFMVVPGSNCPVNRDTARCYSLRVWVRLFFPNQKRRNSNNARVSFQFQCSGHMHCELFQSHPSVKLRWKLDGCSLDMVKCIWRIVDNQYWEKREFSHSNSVLHQTQRRRKREMKWERYRNKEKKLKRERDNWGLREMKKRWKRLIRKTDHYA